MIVGLISSIIGMVGGLLPDIFKEIRASREHAREIERMQVMSDLQLKMLERKTDAKLAELDAETIVQEIKAFRAQMENIYEAQKPIGVKWVDAWNALVRPATASLLMLLFVVTAGLYCWDILAHAYMGGISWPDASKVIWGSLVGDAIQGVLGFLFGFRSTRNTIPRYART